MSYTYKEQLSIVRDIVLVEGERKTLNCPFCGGSRKFSITKTDGKVLWNCFRASCAASGSYQGTRSIDACKAKLSPVKAAPEPVRTATPLPSITTAVRNHPPALQYVTDNNCLPALEAGRITIRYAPALHRVLFYTHDGKGAVGRSLVGSKYKWWSYGDVSGGIKVGTGDTIIAVEDVASACAISNINGLVGMAMLGTTLTNEVCKQLREFRSAFIVLDNDASSKAMSIAKKVGGATTVRLTKKDLKWLRPEEIEAVLTSETYV